MTSPGEEKAVFVFQAWLQKQGDEEHHWSLWGKKTKLWGKKYPTVSPHDALFPLHGGKKGIKTRLPILDLNMNFKSRSLKWPRWCSQRSLASPRLGTIKMVPSRGFASAVALLNNHHCISTSPGHRQTPMTRRSPALGFVTGNCSLAKFASVMTATLPS